MTKRFSAKQRLLLGTILAGAGTLLMPTAAWADCNGVGTSVICSGTDPDAYQTSTTGVTIDVQPTAAVGTGGVTPSPLLSAGSTSVLNNYGAVNSGATAVSLGGGSTVNNFTTSDTLFGVITGDVDFAATTGSAVNTLNNLDWASVITGDINSAGALAVFNNDFAAINGNITSAGPLSINNTDSFINGNIIGSSSADTITINGVGQINGNIALGSGNDTVINNYWIGGTVDLGSGDNSLTNGFSVAGNIIAGSGNDTVTNNSTAVITGDIDLGDGNNIISNAGAIIGNVATGAGDDTLANDPATGVLRGNVDLGSGTDTISNLVGSGTVTKSGTGTLTLTGNNSGFSAAFGTTTVLNLNGGAVSIGSANNMFNGALTFDGGTLQTTGALTLPDAITLNAGGGSFDTGADLTLSQAITGTGGLTKTGSGNLTLGGPNTYSGGTAISAGTLTGTTSSLQGNIVDNAALVFDQNFSGTYAGNISGTGSVARITSNTVTFTGTNTYSGATLVSSGVLAVSGTGIGDLSATTVASGAILQLAANETIGSLAGAGTLTGAFTLTAGGNNTSSTFSGPITGTGITKVGTGTLTLSGTGTPAKLAANGGTLTVSGTYTTAAPSTAASGGTLNIATGGTLTGGVNAASGSTLIINGSEVGAVTNAGAASGTGMVTGAFTNSGSLSPGNDGTGIFGVVNGPFTQTASGTLNIDLTPSGVAGTGYDQILVTGTPGTAVLDGTLALQPQTGVLYVAGTNYDIINAAGGISGAFATTTGATISPFLSFNRAGTTGIVTIAGTNQVYRLTVSRTSYAAGIGASATPNQIAVVTGFQGLVTGATGDAAALVTAVDNMTVAQAESFFDQASPEPYGAYANSLYNQGELFTRQVALQMHSTPNGGGGFSIWGRGYGQWGKGRSDSFRFGSNQDVYGAALGLDYRSGGLTVGAAGGYSHDKIDYKLGNSNGHVNSWQLGGYLDYAVGAFDFDLQAAYEHGNIHANKSIDVTGIANVASIARTASASTSGHLWRAIGTVGYTANLTSDIVARPFIGLDWSDDRVSSFTESGAGAADLTVGDMRIRRTDAVAGFDVGSKRSGLAPYARLAVKYDLKRHNNDVSAFFNGDPTTGFSVSAVRSGRTEFDADLGVSYGINRNFMIFAGYEGTYRKDLRSNGMSAGLRLNFGAPEAAPPPPPPTPPPPPPHPATQTCPNGSVILATDTCPAPPPPPPPPPAPPAERGERG
jgi:outer membrane autotransporter protein